ncbi:Uu.00g031690.m01.CDS01 [Anthostomella pinea]|uniref:Uu.00g031690.m01.CDS01 n=1 Tax=Anthostomella pinea TaxID=933095 RepID=A0AAI8V8J4_9PEZI|nr:Uu.00g031690.m01.CDS01 [Anthostomella pinea]
MADIYRSERLAYIPIEQNKECDDFLYQLLKEPAAVNFDPALPVGTMRSSIEAVTGSISSATLITMYICLPGPDPEPVPVGIIALNRSAPNKAQHGNTYMSLMVAQAQ